MWDHVEITSREFQATHAEFVQVPYHLIPELIYNGQIDGAVWHRMTQRIDSTSHSFSFLPLQRGPVAEILEDLGHLAIVGQRHDQTLQTLFERHIEQGTSLYVILLGHEKDAATVEARLHEIWKTTMSICLEKGAAISHHHGVGLARLSYIQEELETGMAVLEKVKQAIDPNDILNPGKLGFK